MQSVVREKVDVGDIHPQFTPTCLEEQVRGCVMLHVRRNDGEYTADELSAFLMGAELDPTVMNILFGLTESTT